MEERHIRSLTKVSGGTSHAVTIPTIHPKTEMESKTKTGSIALPG